jgi:hypothetical protein
MGKGRIIGDINNPTTTIASGVWNLREHYLSDKDNSWPIIILSGPEPEITGAIGSGTGFGSSPGASLPAGVQIGELLLVLFVADRNRTFTWPAGWIELDDKMNGANSSATIGYKVANGTESTLVSISANAATSTVSTALRIRGNYITPPNRSTVVNGTSNTPNSGSVSLPIGSLGFYISIIAGRANSGTTITSPPSGYTIPIGGSLINPVGGGSFCAVAFKISSVSPEDPGSWTLSSNSAPAWLAWTIAI